MCNVNVIIKVLSGWKVRAKVKQWGTSISHLQRSLRMCVCAFLSACDNYFPSRLGHNFCYSFFGSPFSEVQLAGVCLDPLPLSGD
jgi:hypothetical protein